MRREGEREETKGKKDMMECNKKIEALVRGEPKRVLDKERFLEENERC